MPARPAAWQTLHIELSRVASCARWRFLASRPDNPDLVREYRPDLPVWQAELVQWEERWGRPHPYRGRLF